MAYRDGKMQKSSVPGKKAGPHGSFPVGDPKHARLAIGAATRSERAGHISEATEAHIKAEARKELGEGATHGKGKGKAAPGAFKGNVVSSRNIGNAASPGAAYGKAKGKGARKAKKAKAAVPEFAAGRRSFGGRSFGPFAGGPKAPGLGGIGSGPDAGPDVEAPEQPEAGE